MKAARKFKVPELDLTLQDNRQLSTADLLGNWWVLYFYPKDSTPGCTVENRDFSDLLDQFHALGAQVFGASRDSVRSHQNFCTKQSLRVELISDPDETLCKAFDVIREKNMYGKTVLGIERSTFVIDPEGIVRAEWRKLKVKNHAQSVLDTLRELTA